MVPTRRALLGGLATVPLLHHSARAQARPGFVRYGLSAFPPNLNPWDNTGASAGTVNLSFLAMENRSYTILFASTPNGRNRFWQLFEQGQQGKPELWSYHAPSPQNPLVKPSFLQSQQELLSPTTYAIEYEAKFLQPSGSVFNQESIERALDAKPLPLLKPIVIGIDWARYGDFTAAVVISGNRSNIHVHHIDRLFGSEWANQIAWIKEILHDFRN